MSDLFGHTTADDVMRRGTVTISWMDTLQDAVRLMTEHEIGGLPVLGSSGRVAGMITMSDILRFEEENAQAALGDQAGLLPVFDEESASWQAIRSRTLLEDLPEVSVRDVMTTNPVCVKKTASLREVARQMVDHRVHRILVTGPNKELIGIISSFDFVKFAVDSL